MSRLTNKLNSQYIEAANRLKPKSRRRRIVAYVESYDDVLFWRSVLSQVETEQFYFEILLPNLKTAQKRQKLERGKHSALTALIENQQMGQHMIACVDADYDYLLQGATQSSIEVLHNPYVLHTQAYSIENLQCYAESLHAVTVMATLNDSSLFDFSHFLHTYSKIIYPLFVWHLLFYRQCRFSEFPLSYFCQLIELGKIKPETAYETLESLQLKVTKKLIHYRRHHPEMIVQQAALDKELREQLGVLPQDTYLYIQGHHLFEHVVLPLLQRVCNTLVRQREEEIRHTSLHATQCRNELSCYSSSVQDISQMLKKNLGYQASTIFQTIIENAKNITSRRQNVDRKQNDNRTQNVDRTQSIDNL